VNIESRDFELLKCLDRMWMVFSKVVRVEQDEEIQEFLDAKEEAHKIISTLSGGGDGQRS